MLGFDKIIPINSNISFMDFRKYFIFISIFFILSSISLLFFKGLNLGIDFKGGTLIEIRLESSDHSVSKVRDVFKFL